MITELQYSKEDLMLLFKNFSLKGFIIAPLVPHGTLVGSIDYFDPADILNFHPRNYFPFSSVGSDFGSDLILFLAK